MREWVSRLLAFPEMAGQGHAERIADDNLGLGWLYYGLARVIRPRHAVVIGSYRGFVPSIWGKALADNSEGGEVHFVDPSLVDDFWRDEVSVREHFAALGLTNIRHYWLTTQEFTQTAAYRQLTDVGLVFIDGYHTEEQAAFDFESFRDRLSDDGVVLFHDSITVRVSRIYGAGRHYKHTVRRLIDHLRLDEQLQVLDLPYDAGVTLVRPLPEQRDATATR